MINKIDCLIFIKEMMLIAIILKTIWYLIKVMKNNKASLNMFVT